MNKKQTALVMQSAFARNYGFKFVEAKLTDRPWISIYSRETTEELTAVALYQIKEGYSNMFNIEVDNLRIKVFGTKVVIFDLTRVERVTANADNNVSWYYVKGPR